MSSVSGASAYHGQNIRVSGPIDVSTFPKFTFTAPFLLSILGIPLSFPGATDVPKLAATS
jgi:hypothetical protein